MRIALQFNHHRTMHFTRALGIVKIAISHRAQQDVADLDQLLVVNIHVGPYRSGYAQHARRSSTDVESATQLLRSLRHTTLSMRECGTARDASIHHAQLAAVRPGQSAKRSICDGTCRAGSASGAVRCGLDTKKRAGAHASGPICSM